MNEPLITLDNLSIGYNNQPVLSGISLSIARGSFTAILGANGSGKSTLLKTVLGLLPPVAGRIDTASSNGPLVFGYVPQAIQFDPIYLLTGFDVALMGVYGRVRPGRLVPSSERAFTRECLRAAGAGEFARKRFSRAFRRPETARAHRPRPGHAPRCAGARRTDRRRGPRDDATQCWSSLRNSAGKGGSRSCSSPTTSRRSADTPSRSSGSTRARCCTARRSEILTTERMAEIFEMGIA